MLLSERRQRYRNILKGSECVHPASVFDAMSARMAESLGFEVGMLSGSIASGAVLGAPDLVVLTLTEFAQQAQRITRASDISLMVDADHGYGNALNVMRTVQEMEQAGVSALTIEDTVLPQAFGSKEGLISIPEMVGKLRAALSARQDPSLVIIGRTNTRAMSNPAELEERVKAYHDTGIDGVFLAGIGTAEQLAAVRRATSLPLLLGSAPPELGGREELAAHGVRIALQGHLPFYAATKAVYDTLKDLKEGRSPTDLRDGQASAEVLEVAQKTGDYSRWQREYLS
jgi:carboxyvinyl-carboxyphosphonate phosphorylmutase